MLMIIANNFCAVFLLINFSFISVSPVASKVTEPLSQVPLNNHGLHYQTPTKSTNQRSSILSNVLKSHGIFVPKTPIRLLPKFGSVIDGSLRTKLFRWPKEPANTIEVKPMELSTFLKGLPKITETLWADTAKLIAKPIPLKNVQNYQLLDIQSFNGQHDPSFSDGTYMGIQQGSKPSLNAHLHHHQRPSNGNLEIQSPSVLQTPGGGQFFGKDNDLFSSDFDIINDKFPDNASPYWKVRPSSSAFSTNPSLGEILDVERPIKPEQLLPRPISQSINLYPPKTMDYSHNSLHHHAYAPTQRPSYNPTNIRPCSLSLGNETPTVHLNNDHNSHRVTIPDLKNGGKHGPIIFYRFDDPKLKNIPKEKLFPIFIPNPESGGSTTKLEVIVKNQETVASTDPPPRGKSRNRKRNRNAPKYRENEDDFDDSVDQPKSKIANIDNDYPDEYADDLSNYDPKENENLEVFEDDHGDHRKQDQKRGHHVHHREGSLYSDSLAGKVRIHPNDDTPRSSSASTSATKIIRYHTIENKASKPRVTGRPRLRFRSDKARIKPQASSLQQLRLARGSPSHVATTNSETIEMHSDNSDPSKVARENKVKTGDRQTFDKGVERSKHRVFEHKQEEIWKEKKWNKGGKENTEVESVGTVTEKDKRNGRNGKPRILRYGDKFRPSQPTRYYDEEVDDGQSGKNQDEGGTDEDLTRASQLNQRYSPVTWRPEALSSWKKNHQA